MKILITGANGLLGQKLVKLFSVFNNYEIIATGRGSNRNPTGNYTYYELDVTSEESVRSATDQFKPEAVIHTAAMTNVDQCEEDKENCWIQNVKSVEYLIKSCHQHGSFLLHLSTDFIFDGSAGPYSEDDPPNPQSIYAESKLASEALLKNSAIDWAVVRTILVYGIVHDMTRSNIILWVKKNLEDGKQIRVVNDQWRMPTLAEDLAIGCKLIIDKKAKGVYNISGRDLLTPYEIALEVSDYFNLDKSLISEVDSTQFKQPAKRPAKTGFILDKAYKLGYQPKSFKEGLKIISEQLISHS